MARAALVRAFPMVLRGDDFDFRTQQSFPAWGFPSLAAPWQFADVWERAETQELWEHRHKKRRRDLLGSWAIGENGTHQARHLASPAWACSPLLSLVRLFSSLPVAAQHRDGWAFAAVWPDQV